jgi:hypothetical protein
MKTTATKTSSTAKKAASASGGKVDVEDVVAQVAAPTRASPAASSREREQANAAFLAGCRARRAAIAALRERRNDNNAARLADEKRLEAELSSRAHARASKRAQQARVVANRLAASDGKAAAAVTMATEQLSLAEQIHTAATAEVASAERSVDAAAQRPVWLGTDAEALREAEFAALVQLCQLVPKRAIDKWRCVLERARAEEQKGELERLALQHAETVDAAVGEREMCEMQLIVTQLERMELEEVTTETTAEAEDAAVCEAEWRRRAADAQQAAELANDAATAYADATTANNNDDDDGEAVKRRKRAAKAAAAARSEVEDAAAALNISHEHNAAAQSRLSQLTARAEANRGRQLSAEKALLAQQKAEAAAKAKADATTKDAKACSVREYETDRGYALADSDMKTAETALPELEKRFLAANDALIDATCTWLHGNGNDGGDGGEGPAAAAAARAAATLALDAARAALLKARALVDANAAGTTVQAQPQQGLTKKERQDAAARTLRATMAANEEA